MELNAQWEEDITGTLKEIMFQRAATWSGKVTFCQGTQAVQGKLIAWESGKQIFCP